MPQSPEQPDSVIDEGTIHDLLNPLTAILGNLQLLEDFLAESPKPALQRRVQASLAAANELHRMLENLRQLLAPNRLPEPAEPIDLLPLLHEAFNELDEPTPTPIQVVAGPVAPVRAAPDPLRRALAAILSAARRAGSVERITLQTDAHTIQLTIPHRGRILPEAITQRFFLPELARRQEEHNVKIDRAHGLWFARVALERYSASVRYESRDDGGDFVVTLPVI